MSETPEAVALETLRESYGALGWGADGDLEDGLVAMFAKLIRRERGTAFDAGADAGGALLDDDIFDVRAAVHHVAAARRAAVEGEEEGDG
jgi:hypothetical protein